MDRIRIAIFVTGVVVGLAAAIAFHYQSVSDALVSTLVSVYAILGGFIVGMMALSNDVTGVNALNRNVAEALLQEMTRQSNRVRAIFYVYLLTLIASVSFLVFRDTSTAISDWTYRITVFLVTASLIWALELPRLLYALQKQKLDALRSALNLDVQ